MISYNPKSWVQLIFAFHKSDTFRILWKEIIYIGVFTLFIAWIELNYFPDAVVLEKLISVYSLIGFVISLLLVFRTNTAYDRWWEGRKKWGEIVNDTRNLSLKLSAILSEKEERDFFRRNITAFVIAMKEHLRDGVDVSVLPLNTDEKSEVLRMDHVPVAIVGMMYRRLKELRTKGMITELEFVSIDSNLNALLNSLGACERIKNTPIPYSYSLFLKKFIFVYVTTLPFAFVNLFGYYASLIATFVFYVLVSMEVLAEEIEDPFGTDDNDLPTDQLTERIEKVVNQILE
jgi:ion channel-forming bestrophin family protein